jgi:hypothetical protein
LETAARLRRAYAALLAIAAAFLAVDGIGCTLLLAQPLTNLHQIGVWRTIRVFPFSSVIQLRETLEDVRCGSKLQTVSSASLPRCKLGEAANEIIGRLNVPFETGGPVDLVRLSAMALGFSSTDAVPLSELFERAELAGYKSCPPEVGPLLRLQYMRQPVGEFLHIAMQPIADYEGNPTIFVVGNGGAGLLLVGSGGAPETRVSTATAFVFTRSR